MSLQDLHNILFNMQSLYSFALGLFAAVLAAREQPLSGGFWGSVVIYVLINLAVLILGIISLATGFTIQSGERVAIYFLYMAFLIVIMPGLFSLQRGQDDRRAALTFAALAIFNATVSLSMAQRGLATWIPIS